MHKACSHLINFLIFMSETNRKICTTFCLMVLYYRCCTVAFFLYTLATAWNTFAIVKSIVWLMWTEMCYLLSERQEAQILKFNALPPPPPYTLSLSCPSYSKFSQLSYEPGCSRELWCRKCATWLWNKYVLIFSKALFYTHIQRHTAAAGTKCYKTM